MSVDQRTKELWNKFDSDISKRSYAMRLILALDQLLNVAFMNGSQDQTISGHIAKKQYEGNSRWYHDMLCCVLKKIEAKHCWLSRKE